jgi:hypothetical protein
VGGGIGGIISTSRITSNRAATATASAGGGGGDGRMGATSAVLNAGAAAGEGRGRGRQQLQQQQQQPDDVLIGAAGWACEQIGKHGKETSDALVGEGALQVLVNAYNW